MKSHRPIPQSGTAELLLLDAIILDAGVRCGVSVERDINYARQRTMKEGYSFLYTVLPQVSSFLERSLERGWMDVDLDGFSQDPDGFPTFLGGFFRLIFSTNETLKDSEDVADAILCVRQISRLFKKIEVPCSPENIRKAVDQYVTTDNNVRDHVVPSDTPVYQLYSTVADILWSSSLADLEHEIGNHSLIPCHGSGATADRRRGNGKYRLSSWYSQLDRVFPFSQYLVPDLGFDTRATIGLLEEEPIVRIVTVPKTVATPRVIAVEPTAMQFCQQPLMRGIYRSVDRTWLVNHICFTDQQRNNTFARLGSIDRELATLDLSEASDRVHMHYVWRMFRTLPLLREALFASRSPRAWMPDGSMKTLYKFSSMGSATCFPVETMHFYTVVLAAILEQQSLDCSRVTMNNIKVASQQVSVFGDDIVVPSIYFDAVSRALTLFGLKVNLGKSFVKGYFRESCGGDFYRGVDVKPIYVRHESPGSSRDATKVVSWIELSNLLYQGGWWLAADYCRSLTESIVGKLPIGVSSCLSWVCYQDRLPTNHRWDKNLHLSLVKGWVPKAKREGDFLEGHQALMKFFLTPRGKEILPGIYDAGDPLHLLETDKPYSMQLRRKWVRAE